MIYTKQRFLLKLFYFSYWSMTVYFFMVFPMELAKIYTPAQIGLIIASMTLFKFVSVKLFANLVMNKTKLLIVNNLFILLGVGIYLSKNSIALMVILSVLFGIVNNFVISYFDQIKIKTYRQYLGLFRVYGSFGGLSLFVMLVFFQNSILESGWLFGMYVVLYFVASNMLLYGRKNILNLQNKNTSHNMQCNKNIKILWILGSFMMIFMAFYHTFIGIYLSQVGFDIVDVSLLLGIGIFFEIIAFFIAHKLFNRFSFEQLFLFSTTITALRLIVFDLFWDNFWVLCIVQSLHFFTFGLFYASFMNILKNYYTQSINRALQIFNGYIDGVLKSVVIFILGFALYHGIFAILGGLILGVCIWYFYTKKSEVSSL